MIFTHAPADWDTNGLPYGARCKCSRCGYEGHSTFHFDFYAEKAGDPLVCQTCKWKEARAVGPVPIDQIIQGKAT